MLSTTTISNQTSVSAPTPIPIVGTSSMQASNTTQSQTISTPFSQTRTRTQIALKISFNSEFVSDYSNLNSAAAKIFISNFKNFVIQI